MSDSEEKIFYFATSGFIQNEKEGREKKKKNGCGNYFVSKKKKERSTT